MTTFTIIFSFIIIGLTGLCFWLPLKGGQKKLGVNISLFIGLIIILTLIGNFDFLIIFIWPLIIVFQIVFLTYWTFRNYKRPKTANISVILLTLMFFTIAIYPWIIDWTFSKKDAKEMLSWHKIELKDDFKIVKNESGGFTDYSHSFALKISKSDYNFIADKIRSSNKYLGLITDLSNQLPNADNKSTDTVSYETKSYIESEYYTKDKKEDSTFHFIIKLSKKERELYYFGINE